jgi:hypothetical protein
LIPPPIPAVIGPSPEEIKKAIAEHQAKEARKASSSTSSSNTDKDKEKDKDKDVKPKSPTRTPISPAIPIPATTNTPPIASHRKFALHRQVFDMRRAEIRRREQGVKAKEVSKGECS